MRLSDYRPVLTCALVYGLAAVPARFAFEDGSNAAMVVSVRCAFAALGLPITAHVIMWPCNDAYGGSIA